MTYKMQTLRVAALMLALVTLTALHATAQPGKIDDDLQRAQAILNELAAGSVDRASLQLMEAEIARIEAHDYVVTVKLTTRAYAGGSGYFPVTVSRAGLIDPPVKGRVEIPKSKARRAKSQCARSRNSIYGLGSYEGRRSGKNTRRSTTFSRASLPMSKWICGR